MRVHVQLGEQRRTSGRSRRRRGAGRVCGSGMATMETKRERQRIRIRRGGRIRSSRLRCRFGGRRQGSKRETSQFLEPLCWLVSVVVVCDVECYVKLRWDEG